MRLAYAAKRRFGSWEKAVQYASVDVRHVGARRDLTADQVKQQLRRLCTTGYDRGATVNRTRDRVLYDAALHIHGAWRAAITAAGINLANVSRRRPDHFDREAMIHWLQHRQVASQSLTFTDVCLEHRDNALAIRPAFGNWAKAIGVAGCNSGTKFHFPQ